MAQPVQARRRTPKVGRRSASPNSQKPGIEPRRYLPHISAIGLIALSLASALALYQPEGSIAGPLGRFLTLSFGWLAVLMPIWLAGIALLLIQKSQFPGPWPRRQLIAATTATLAALGLGGLEAMRRGGTIQHPGGGALGWTISDALAAAFGVPSTALLLTALLVPSLAIMSGLTMKQTRGALAFVAQRTWRRVQTAKTQSNRPALRINGQVTGIEIKNPQPASEPALAAEAPTPAPLRQPGRHADSWKVPPLTMFQLSKGAARPISELREQARIIEETLASFKVSAKVVEANQGPAVTQFGIEPGMGVPVSRIMARANDLALRLGSSPIRMEAPVPGRRMVGLEVPNPTVALVTLREVMESPAVDRAKSRIPLALGKDTTGKASGGDLARMPHLLIAGATGSGKSVCINSVVACLLSQFTPDEMQMIMIDPKMVELSAYNGVPHLRMPVVTDMDKVVGTLKWVIQEMERRYKLFSAHSARNIDGFNRLVREGKVAPKPGMPPVRPMPYMVVIIDELADLMMTAPEEAERSICRLAQLARATGIHLIIATQRPSVDVLTGLIKANFPTRIAFAVTSQVDSRVILDSTGAEQLLGRGDMLYLPPDAGKPVRLQGTYVSDEEIELLVTYWRDMGTPRYDEADMAEVNALARPAEPASDEMFDRAVALAESSQRLSVSYLQRRLGIGYPRAARIMDQLEDQGVVAIAADARSRRSSSDAMSND